MCAIRDNDLGRSFQHGGAEMLTLILDRPRNVNGTEIRFDDL